MSVFYEQINDDDDDDDEFKQYQSSFKTILKILEGTTSDRLFNPDVSNRNENMVTFAPQVFDEHRIIVLERRGA